MVSRRRFLGHTAGALTMTGVLELTSAAVARQDPEPISVALIGCGGMGQGHLRLSGSAQGRADRLSLRAGRQPARTVRQARRVGGPEGAQGRKGHAGDFRRQVGSRRLDRHARPLARPGGDPRAADAGKHVYVEKPCSPQPPRRAADDRGRAAEQDRHAGRHAEPQHAARDPGDEAAPRRGHRQGARRQGVEQPAPRQHRPRASLASPRPTWITTSGSGPRLTSPTSATCCTPSGAGGTRSARATSATTACTTSTWPAGAWASTGHPSTITALGGKYFFDDDQQWPDTQYVVYEYPGDGQGGHKRQLIFEQRTWSPYVQEGLENGDAFYGTDGMMILGKYGGYQLYGPRNKLIEHVKAGSPDLAAHHDDFLACIRSGGTPHADIEINHLTTALCHLANIATRVGRVVRFDPADGKDPRRPRGRSPAAARVPPRPLGRAQGRVTRRRGEGERGEGREERGRRRDGPSFPCSAWECPARRSAARVKEVQSVGMGTMIQS